MTGTNRTSAGLDSHRKRVLFRAWHRGTRELDLLLGGYADTHIADMNNADLADFEALMEIPDTELYDWITVVDPGDIPRFGPLICTIIAFHNKNRETAVR